MMAAMKQGNIYLIHKPDKDPLLIDNWHSITLLTIDYKILALTYSSKLRKWIDSIISETQTVFMKN